MATKKKSLDLDSLLEEIEDEVDEEIEADRIGQLSPEDRVLSQIAMEILRLERDMTKPGSGAQESTRVERLAKFIDEADF